MSSYVLMKILESSPERCDRGIRMLGRGCMDPVYEAITNVVGIGINTGMLAVADETTPRSRSGREAKRLRRLPSVVATWLLTQTTTAP